LPEPLTKTAGRERSLFPTTLVSFHESTPLSS
jgi:hypothetical protein